MQPIEPRARPLREEQLFPSSITSAALSVFGSNHRSTTTGSVESWLANTDDGSQVGGVREQDAEGTQPQPKPITSQDDMRASGNKSISVITKRMPNSAVSAIAPTGPSEDEWQEIEVTVDSGACETVMPTDLCQSIPLMQSLTSHGAEYEVANGESLPNLGERRCLLMTMGAKDPKKITFQVADVHKPLLSISRCADMGFNCHLGKHGGYLEDTVTGQQIPLQRKDNLYVMRAWIRKDPEANGHQAIPSPFAGPGR